MKAFSISNEAEAEVFAAVIALKDVCAKHDLSVAAAVSVGCDKRYEEDGIEVANKILSMSSLVGIDRTPSELVFMHALTKEGGGIDALAHAVSVHRRMVDKYGALLAEDNAQEACIHYKEHGDMDAARRIGGSLV